ncbi:phosphotransferase [Paenibacillus sp. P96]|uniref:Phosphotransferase n=1 Tax=Paenibacillus zeirhizosphaerae TaxID=2987519 RepID=A0ABT9FL99_9BACL|nr:phosphotransferase [Paenibacillus sp. P96]MDP4095507.1 phosphotransferase [Paenibacillus sp. P96]
MIGTLIGQGNTADIFDAGNNRVVKLFKYGYPLDDVRLEINNSRLLNGLNLPTSKSYELVTHEGRHGILYDKIDGQSLLELVLQTGEVERYAVVLAQFHKRILACKLEGAASLKSILKRNIERANDLTGLCKSQLYAVLEALPDGGRLCHGDYHFDNVLVNDEKNYIIDYMNVCRGHEYGDVARTVYLIEMTPVPSQMSDVERILWMKKRATDVYLQEMGVPREELSEWLLVTVAARLSELSGEQRDEKNSVLKFLSMWGVYE